jgi:hypothetical protein
MNPATEPTILQNLLVLAQTVGTLLVQLVGLGFHWMLWLFLAAWCLWGINWRKLRHFLAVGGWAPAVLLILLTALVWAAIDPRRSSWGIPNFWWQLGVVSILAAVAMFLGWIQTVMHWTPHEINLDPPAHGHGHSHDHGHAHH